MIIKTGARAAEVKTSPPVVVNKDYVPPAKPDRPKPVVIAPAGITVPGLYYGVQNESYHADRNSLSVSGAKTIVKQSLAHFRYQQDHPVHKAVFDVGSAAHSLALEGHLDGFVEVPDSLLSSNGALSTKAAKEWVGEQRAAGLVPLKSDVVRDIEGMAEALRGHPAAKVLLAKGQAEVSAYREHDSGLLLRARYDWLPDDRSIIPDYKTAATAEVGGFQRNAATMGYHQQAAWYIDMAKALGIHSDPSFLFVVQEKTAPYLVNVIEFDVTALDYGRQLNEKAISMFNHAVKTNEWPGYPMNDPIPLPKYAEYDAERLLENE